MIPIPAIQKSRTSEFLRKYCLYKPKEHRSDQITHRSLAGGNFVVPDAEYATLLRSLVDDRRCSSRNWLVEVRTVVFRFFLDIDLLDDHELSLAEWSAFVTVCQRALQEFDAKADCFLTLADCDPIADKGLKNGAHLYWPDVWVNQELALQIHAFIIVLAQEAHGNDYKGQDWTKVYDPSVLKGNGLRMLFSHKSVACSTCRDFDKANRARCGACSGTGHIDTRRPYTPVAVFDADMNFSAEKTARFKGDVLFALEMTSIRVPDAAAHVVQYQCPDHVLALIPQITVKPVTSARTGVATPGSRSEYKRTVNGQNMVFCACENKDIANVILNFLLETGRHLVGPSGQQGVKAFYKSRCGKAYMMVGTNKFCNNVGRSHTGQDIYYVITRHGLVQHCWSQKNDCSTYTSAPPVPLTPLLLNMLFEPEVLDAPDLIQALPIWTSYDPVTHLYHQPDNPIFTHFLLGRASYQLCTPPNPNDPLYKIAHALESHIQLPVQQLHWPPKIQ